MLLVIPRACRGSSCVELAWTLEPSYTVLRCRNIKLAPTLKPGAGEVEMLLVRGYQGNCEKLASTNNLEPIKGEVEMDRAAHLVLTFFLTIATPLRSRDQGNARPTLSAS